MSRYVVKSNIPFGSALAYSRGQTIDGDAVERNKWHDYVVGANTKEGRQILAEATGEPFDDEDDDKSASDKPASTSTKTSEKKG